MKILLLQLDGKLPNLALMRIAAHHRRRGDWVEFRQVGQVPSVVRALWDDRPDRTYASLIFERTRPLGQQVLQVYPDAIIGGTGWDLARTIEQVGIATRQPDYSLYPNFQDSIGFTQRGCRLKCPFCVVPKKEGRVREENSIWDIYRGEPFPRHVLLLDNDFFGQPNWRTRIEELKAGNFKVCFSQGINARLLTDEAAAALASVRYSDDQFRRRRLYTAWDNRNDEERLFKGLETLVRYGVKPDEIMVYMLVGYWAGETAEDREYRRRRLREFGARPYPMPFVRTPELIGFQRWVIGAYDKRIPWQDWQAAQYRPERLMGREPIQDRRS